MHGALSRAQQLNHSEIAYTLRCRYNAVHFLKKLRKVPHSSPVRAKYGVSFVGSAPDWYSASVPAMMYAICWYIGPRYNATRLYMAKCVDFRQRCHHDNSRISPNHWPAGLGVTKAPFVNLSISKIFDFAKVLLGLFESHLYLTGATTAELRRHLSNINVIFDR